MQDNPKTGKQSIDEQKIKYRQLVKDWKHRFNKLAMLDNIKLKTNKERIQAINLLKFQLDKKIKVSVLEMKHFIFTELEDHADMLRDRIYYLDKAGAAMAEGQLSGFLKEKSDVNTTKKAISKAINEVMKADIEDANRKANRIR